MNPISLFSAAFDCLMCSDLDTKLELSKNTAQAWREGKLSLNNDIAPSVQAVPVPGRPARPELVAPRHLMKRKLTTPQGRLVLLHALSHIEFNAINLAWDAVYRFRGLPSEYYADWIRIADEETYHFELLRAHLQSDAADYGDFPAHNGLWELAQETAHDVLVRMALVPRVMEARGLDVTPGIMEKLKNIGDNRAVEILEIIFRDEIGHVAAGTRWFRHVCAERGVEPEATFQDLLQQHLKGQVRPPFHQQARTAAGFSLTEMDMLAKLSA